MQLENIRREYKRAELNENNIDQNPIIQFRKWLNVAISSYADEATAMSFISLGSDGFPQSRIVLLKEFDEKGFTFFTNYSSEKGKAIVNQDKVGLHFFWPELERQIRISGLACKTSVEASRKYFHSRPQKSQIAATISPQSAVIPTRQFLENKFAELSEKLNGINPEYPEYWGGYLIKPVKFEFWQGRENRLHDRLVYEKKEDLWEIKRLAP